MGLGKTYDSYGDGRRLASAIPWREQRLRRPTESLSDVNLRVEPGESVGIIGPNGAGKSTLLRLIAGITRPTSGSVTLGGPVSAILELGLGFHPDLSGWENMACSAAILGMSREAVAEAKWAMAEFSGLGDKLDAPLRGYSSGMRARLGFSVAVHAPASILIVDEILAVGDRDFQSSCLERIGSLKEAGTTLLFVSHQMPLASAMCTRGIHLRAGRIVDDDVINDVIERYLARTTSTFRPMKSPPMKISVCSVPSPELRPWDSIEIDLEVRVDRPTPRAGIGVDLGLPALDADLVFGSHNVSVSSFSSPGRYRLHGRSRPFPGDGGTIRVVVSLVDGDAHRLADSAAMDLVIEGGRSGRPYLAVEPHCEIWPGTAPDHALCSGAAVSSPVAKDLATLRGVTKLYPSQARTDRGVHIGRTKKAPALENVDLTLHAGEVLGIIGPNGAGKSTLIRLLAGITTPDVGEVAVQGRVVPVSDLGLGFHPSLSGMQNLELTSRILGMTAGELSGVINQIIDYFGLPEVIDHPVRTYSTGMRARLGFALAMYSSPELLLLDETLAVGDEAFRQSAVDRVQEMSAAGTSVAVASHDLGLIEQISDNAVLFDRGRVRDSGAAAAVVSRYGGSGAGGGSRDMRTGGRIHRFEVRRTHIPVGGTLDFDGLIEIDDPSSATRLELSYRASLDVDVPSLSRLEVEERSSYVVTLEPSGGALATRGWHNFRGSVDRNDFHGEIDVVVALIDAHDNVVLSEAWQRVVVGRPGPGQFPYPALEFVWTILPLTEETDHNGSTA